MNEKTRQSIYSPVEIEIDGIRDKIYHELQGKEIPEITDYYRRETAPIIEKYHLRLVKNAGTSLYT
jgi:hypothetical protein